MEKGSFRANPAKGQVCDSKKLQDVKQWPKNSRRRESPNGPNSKSEPLRNKPTQSNNKPRQSNFNEKRPKPRGVYHDSTALEFSSTPSTGLDNELTGFEAEVNSVFVPGSKKQNLNHLLNFHYVPRERDANATFSRTGNNRTYVKKNKYNKEHYLQANCKFVVKSNEDYSSLMKSPDTLVAWDNIEQVIVQSTEEPQCPICLFSPVAGKMTKCGHIYCWSCILHYLALSDKLWRKCPICYEAVYIKDLKSVVSKPYKKYSVGDHITLQLMRREKGCLSISKANSKVSEVYKIPHLSECRSDDGLNTKLLLANDYEIKTIIDREKNELEQQIYMDGEHCPESIFTLQALDLLRERQEELKNAENKMWSDGNEYEMSEKMDKIDEASSSPTSEKEAFIIDEESNLTIDDINIVPVNLSKYHFFYQADDGQHLYLHSINVRMLQNMYGSLERSPLVISGRIMQKESCSMNEDLRKRLKYLDHLPITTQFEITELNFDHSIISNEVADKFRDELQSRKKLRQRRAREENIREKRIFMVNERQLGKVLMESAKIDIDSNTHFPSCGSFDVALSPSPSYRDDFLETFGSTPPKIIAESPNSKNLVSFAKMLTESPKEKWPSLASKSSTSSLMPPTQDKYSNLTQIFGKNGANVPIHNVPLVREEVDEDEEMNEFTRIPEFRQNFSSAIAEALEKVDISLKKVESDLGASTTNGKKKKNKNKKTLLFSTGMAINNGK